LPLFVQMKKIRDITMLLGGMMRQNKLTARVTVVNGIGESANFFGREPIETDETIEERR
jgi:hypothetical protein